MPMKTGDEIKEIVERAFRPLRCVAEIRDYGQKLRFRVFDQNDVPIFSCPELLIHTPQDDAQLTAVISQARTEIEGKGVSLLPWSAA